MNNAEMANMLMMVFTIAIIVTFVVAIGLFFLLIFMRKPKSGVRLFSINDRQELAGNEETYFSYIKYDQEKRSIILKQSQVFGTCVVTLILKSNGKKSMRRYNLEYVPGDLFCAIRVDGQVEEYRVILESVEKSAVKHPNIDNSSSNAVTYGIVVSILFAISMFIYIFMCSFLLLDEWPAFAIFYGFAALGLVFLVIIIAGHFLGEVLSKKGSF